MINNGKISGGLFTPTFLRDDKLLEFLIKRYPDHDGVTNQLHTLAPGSSLLLSEPFGTVESSGPGTSIAIFRDEATQSKLRGSQLLFSNKTSADIIVDKELRFCE